MYIAMLGIKVYNVGHRVNQLYFTCNTNFVYCFYYYIIIELVSFSCHCTKRNNLCNYSHKYDGYNTYGLLEKESSLYNISYKLSRSNEHIKIVILSSFLLAKSPLVLSIYVQMYIIVIKAI